METFFPKSLFEIGAQEYRIDGIAIRKQLGKSHFSQERRPDAKT